MIKGIIFDVDGTTLSTLCDIREALNITLENHKFELQSYEDVRLHIGRGSKNLIKDSLPQNVSKEVIDLIEKEYLGKYREHYNVKTKPYDGIKELLDELQNKDILLAINSNKPDEFTKNLMKYHFPGINFIAVIGSRIGIPNKPDPFSANEIVEKMGLDRNEILYVGDSDSDVKTAKNAGLKVVGCLWGFRDYKNLSEAGADIIISEPKELLNYLD